MEFPPWGHFVGYGLGGVSSRARHRARGKMGVHICMESCGGDLLVEPSAMPSPVAFVHAEPCMRLCVFESMAALANLGLVRLFDTARASQDVREVSVVIDRNAFILYRVSPYCFLLYRVSS